MPFSFRDLRVSFKEVPINFLGIPKEFSEYSRSRVAILPVPYEATVSYGGGTERGPSAIIEASDAVELYDEELRCQPYEVGIATLKPIDLAEVKPDEIWEYIVPAVSKIIADGKWPLVFGGEHSVTPPVVKAVACVHKDLTVVQFDAHADLREEYKGTKMSHACAMARVREICPAVQIGIRSMSREEGDVAARKKYPIFYANDIRRDPEWKSKAISEIRTRDVYVTFDIDAFDPSLVPATGTPEPGGLLWYEVVDFLKMLFKERNVIGADIVELAPIENLHACDFLAAKLAYKMIGYKFSEVP